MGIKKRISLASIKELRPEDKRLNDTDIPGFHALIAPTGRITYYIYYRHNGKQANFKLGVHGHLTPAQARDLAMEKLGEVAKGDNVQAVRKETRQRTLAEKHKRLDSFLEHQYRPWLETRNPKTAKSIVDRLRTQFPELMEKPLDQITPWDLEKWRSRRAKEIKPATLNYYITTLKGALSRAVEWGVIERHDLGKVKALKVDNTIVRYLTSAQELKLRETLKGRDQQIKDGRESGNSYRVKRGYRVLPNIPKGDFADHLEPIVLLAMNTGMRRGELFGLTWADVNFHTRVATIRGAIAKSSKARHIPLNGEATEVLTRWREQNPDTLYVFEGESGKALTDFKKSWLKVAEEAGLSEFRFHDLRHHFASKLVMKGVDLNTVRELLGHADLKMTLRYAHLAPEHKAAAVNLIG